MSAGVSLARKTFEKTISDIIFFVVVSGGYFA